MMRVLIPWTAEDDAVVRAGIAAGLTMQTISEQLGRTRNSVIGRTHKLKLRSQGARVYAVVAEVITEPPEDHVQAVEPGGVRMADIGPDRCRWPLWGENGWPDFRMCGAPGYPWCERHRVMAQPRAGRGWSDVTVTAGVT